MSGPPFVMSMYASETDLLRDKCAWLERELAEKNKSFSDETIRREMAEASFKTSVQQFERVRVYAEHVKRFADGMAGANGLYELETCIASYRKFLEKHDRTANATATEHIVAEFKCCGAGECKTFEESCQNPANYPQPKCSACGDTGWRMHRGPTWWGRFACDECPEAEKEAFVEITPPAQPLYAFAESVTHDSDIFGECHETNQKSPFDNPCPDCGREMIRLGRDRSGEDFVCALCSIESYRGSRHQSCTQSTTAYMDTPHYRVNKFAAAVHCMPGAVIVASRLGLQLALEDLEAVVRDSAPLYTGERHQVCNVPEGWKLVPLKPTDAMLQAGEDMIPWAPGSESRRGVPGPQEFYRSMIAVAPDYEFVACTKQEGARG